MQFTSYLTNSSIYSVFLDPVTEKQVENELKKLKDGKSCGYDEMSPKVMRKMSKHIPKPLTHIYNQSSLTGIIPTDPKIALVTPTLRANDKELFSNYRPISILPCFSKILEN